MKKQKKLAEAFIEVGYIAVVCQCAESLPDILVSELAQEIIAKGKVDWMLKFAIHVKGAPIYDLAQAVIETKEAEYIYYFASEVENAPIEDLSHAISNLKDFNYLCLFIKFEINVNQLFIAIIKSLEIETLPEVKIENILVKFAETGVFNINVLTDFLVYWAQQISVGVNIFEEPTQIGEDSIGGSQFVLLPNTETNL